MKRFVAIAGNIAVGKSTLTALLRDRLDWEPFFEAVNDNPYQRISTRICSTGAFTRRYSSFPAAFVTIGSCSNALTR